MNICMIGGDLRIIRLAEMYAKEGNRVYTYGLEKYFLEGKLVSNDGLKNKIKEENTEINYKDILLCSSISEAVSMTDIVISSMPFSKDDIYVNSPFAKEKIKIQELKDEISGKNFIAGGIPQEFYNGKINNIDLLENEKLTILNAIPTAEGTIRIAIEEREETIHESNVLVCGFGRIGKILCNRFKALGASVYCVARKETDLTWIREEGYTPLTYNDIPEIGEKIDIIINTVPTLVLNKKELDSFISDVLIIDVASNPGGVDKEYAKSKQIKIITALGIPGKEMPKTAAKYIKEVIDKNLRRKNID